MGCGGSTAAATSPDETSQPEKKTKDKKKSKGSAITQTDATRKATKHKGKVIEDYYTLSDQLGQGQFSKVYKGTAKEDGSVYAVKAVNKHNKSFSEAVLDAEVSILLDVDHSNIIKLYEVFDSPHKFYMVLEFVKGGELFDHIVQKGHYSEHDAARITEQILSALAYLHAKNIVHRDLKPENLLCEDTAEGDITTVKIADFGLSIVKSRDMVLETSCGTPGYVAPEVLQPPPDHSGYTTEVDLWSLGVILYILLCGFPPFYNEQVQRLFQAIVKGKYDFPSPEWDDVSDTAKDLVNSLLVVDPAKRMTAEEALAHPFITSEVSKEHRGAIVDSMKRWNATRKLKGAVHAIMIAQATSNLISDMPAAAANTTAA